MRRPLATTAGKVMCFREVYIAPVALIGNQVVSTQKGTTSQIRSAIHSNFAVKVLLISRMTDSSLASICWRQFSIERGGGGEFPEEESPGELELESEV